MLAEITAERQASNENILVLFSRSTFFFIRSNFYWGYCFFSPSFSSAFFSFLRLFSFFCFPLLCSFPKIRFRQLELSGKMDFCNSCRSIFVFTVLKCCSMKIPSITRVAYFNRNIDRILTRSYRFLSFSAIASYLDLTVGSTSDHFFPNSLAMSPTPYSGFKALTFVRSSLQNQKKADLIYINKYTKMHH